MVDIQKAVSVKNIQLDEFGNNYTSVYVLYSLYLCHKYIHHFQKFPTFLITNYFYDKIFDI